MIFRFLLLFPIFCFSINFNCQTLHFTDTNNNDKINVVELMQIADSYYDNNYDLYVEKYLEIEKNLQIVSDSLTSDIKNEIYYALGDIYYEFYYNNYDSCFFGRLAYDYFNKCDSIEMASIVLVDYSTCKNLNNEYNESINLILNQFLILDSLSNNLYNSFSDELIWSLKNNLGISYYNSNQFLKSKKICEELLYETKILDTSELVFDIENYEIMNLINYSNSLHKLNKLNESIKFNKKALSIIGLIDTSHYFIGAQNMIKRNLSKVFFSTGQYDEANELLFEIIKTESDSTNIAILFYDIAIIQTKQKQYLNAIKNLKNSKKYK